MIRISEDGTIDRKAIKISDIVNINLLQDFQDNFTIGMNCAGVTVDRNGTSATKPSSYTRFCDGFVYKTKIIDDHCSPTPAWESKRQ